MIKKFNIYFRAVPFLWAFFSAGCALTLPGVAVPGNLPVVATTPLPEAMKMPEHERLVYRITWLGLTAGELVAEVKGRVMWRGRPCYLIEVSARTLGMVAKFYPVEDHYRSYLDAEKFYSLRHEENRREGSYRKDAVTDFDHEAGKASFRNAVDKTEKTFDIPPGVQDNLTSAYIGRLMPLEPGQVYTFKVCNSEKVYDLFVSVSVRARVMGRLALHLTPFARLNGEDFREGRASGYVTDDEKKVPFLVVIKAPVFTRVTAVLQE